MLDLVEQPKTCASTSIPGILQGPGRPQVIGQPRVAENSTESGDKEQYSLHRVRGDSAEAPFWRLTVSNYGGWWRRCESSTR